MSEPSDRAPLSEQLVAIRELRARIKTRLDEFLPLFDAPGRRLPADLRRDFDEYAALLDAGGQRAGIAGEVTYAQVEQAALEEQHNLRLNRLQAVSALTASQQSYEPLLEQLRTRAREEHEELSRSAPAEMMSPIERVAEYALNAAAADSERPPAEFEEVLEMLTAAGLDTSLAVPLMGQAVELNEIRLTPPPTASPDPQHPTSEADLPAADAAPDGTADPESREAAVQDSGVPPGGEEDPSEETSEHFGSTPARTDFDPAGEIPPEAAPIKLAVETEPEEEIPYEEEALDEAFKDETESDSVAPIEPVALEAPATAPMPAPEAVLAALERAVPDSASPEIEIDLSLCYWTTVVLEALEANAALTSNAVAAQALAEHVAKPDDPFALSLETFLAALADQSDLPEPSAIVATVAAGVAALRNSYGNAVVVLERLQPTLPPPFGELARSLVAEARSGTFSAIGDRDVALEKAQLEKLRAEARELREQMVNAKQSYVPAITVLRELTTRGALNTLFEAIEGRGPVSAELRRILDPDPRLMDRMIDDTLRANDTRQQIHSKARRWLHEWIGLGLSLGRRWAETADWLAEHEEHPGTTQLTAFIKRLDEEFADGVEATLADLRSSSDPVVTAAGAIATRGWWFMAGTVRGKPAFAPPELTRPAELLNVSLVRAVGVPLDDELRPSADLLELSRGLTEAAASACSPSGWSDACLARCEEGRFDLARLALLRVDPRDEEKLERKLASMLAEAHEELRAECVRTEERLDVVYREVLDDAAFAAASDQLRAIDLATDNVASQREDLEALRTMIEVPLTNLRERVTEEIERVDPSPEWRAGLSRLVDEEQFALATEYLNQLVADPNAKPPPQHAPEPPYSSFAKFMRTFERDSLAGQSPQGSVTSEQVWRYALAHGASEPDRAAWQELDRLRKERAMGAGTSGPAISRALKSLGFTASLTPVDPNSNWLAFNMKTAPLEPLECPVLELGSRAQGNYRLVVAHSWEKDFAATHGRDFVDLLVRRFPPGVGPPLFVLVVDRLTAAHRETIRREAIAKRATFMLVDETAAAWVSIEASRKNLEHSRRRLVLDTALANTAVNPFITQGVTPAEVFVGRDAELHEVVTLDRPCFVYGGRQYGKTSLLFRARDRFHRPQDNAYAILLSLDATTAHSSPEKLWHELARELKARGVPDWPSDLDAPDDVVTAIREWTLADSSRRLLILLDEADLYLAMESRRGGGDQFHGVMRMRELMDTTGRRVKFVLSGLQDVQRFQGWQRQPFSALGARSIRIGPLDRWTDAAELPRLLERLGFAPEPHVIDRIVMLANRHPSLLQNICHELVEHLGEKKANRPLPCPVTLADVDAVYGQRSVREQIRRRFDWTIDRDVRYRAIAYVLALASFDDPVLMAHGMERDELERRAASAVPDAFADGSEETQRVCHELVELSVLTEHSGRFRLRSHNVLDLLGPREQIADRLRELRGQSPRSAFEPHRMRRRSRRDKSGAECFSPLTFGDEVTLLGSEGPSVGVIVGTSATAIDDVAGALEQTATSIDWRAGNVVRHASTDKLLRGSPSKQTINVLTVPAGEIARLPLLVKRAARELNGVDGTRAVFVVRTQDDNLAWVDALRSAERELGGRDSIIALKRWSPRALEHELLRLDLPDASPEDARAVHAATGGWPLLVELLLSTLVEEVGVSTALERAAASMEWDRLLLEALGLDEITLRVSEAMAAYREPITAEDLADLSDMPVTDVVKALDGLLARQAVIVRPASHADPLGSSSSRDVAWLEPRFAAALAR